MNRTYKNVGADKWFIYTKRYSKPPTPRDNHPINPFQSQSQLLFFFQLLFSFLNKREGIANLCNSFIGNTIPLSLQSTLLWYIALLYKCHLWEIMPCCKRAPFPPKTVFCSSLWDLRVSLRLVIVSVVDAGRSTGPLYWQGLRGQKSVAPLKW